MSQQQIIIIGAGSAARGIADQIVTAIMEETNADIELARSHIWLVDSKGLVTLDRVETLSHHKQAFARVHSPLPNLLAVIEAARPDILIGVSGQYGIFSEKVIKTIHNYATRPIILALSNPTSKAECTAEQAYTWTDGAAIFASGSPFAPVTHNGKIFVPGQCNNMYIFPGVGLGAITCKTTTISNRMFYAAARTLAEEVSDEMLAVGQLYPDLRRIRDISVKIATAVCEVAFTEGSARISRPDDLAAYIRSHIYQPHYVPYQATDL